MYKAVFALTTILIITFSAVTNAEPNKAPDWQLPTQSGGTIKSGDYQGQPVILHFWATWCPYCKKLQPKLVEMQKKYQDHDVQLVGISFNEDPGATPQDVLNNRGHNITTAVDGDKIAEMYGVVGTPTTFYINKKGNIIFKSTSSDVSDPRIELAVKEIIK